MWQLSLLHPDIAKALKWKPTWVIGKPLGNKIWKVFNEIRNNVKGYSYSPIRGKPWGREQIYPYQVRLKTEALRKLLVCDAKIFAASYIIITEGMNQTSFKMTPSGLKFYNGFEESANKMIQIIINKGIII